ncbi:MAG: rRNA pseudouridine synthase [Christensenellaceae bacterium]|nr:rRNA pseudouridine synthase [Christensenellaceae bacterium]
MKGETLRIAKFLASAGVASRRKCEELIFEGKVSVNGVVISEPGTRVDPANDKVRVGKKLIEAPEEKVYIMFNKPVGCVSTCSDDKGRTTVLDYITGINERIYPVGRLDFTTEGLLLLTNDGELANRLTHPRHEVGKRYLVIVEGDVTSDDVKKLEKGIFIEGGKTAPARIKILKRENGKTELTIIIHEGRNHQVKKMFEAVEKKVVFLKRISVGDINLGQLKKGEYRHLSAEEVAYLKSIK